MTGFGKRAGGGRRAAAREPVLLEAALLTLQSSHSVVVVNVSASGARLQGCDLPDDGDDIWLKIGSLDILGTVAWRRRALCGVSLDEPLTESQLAYLRRQGAELTIGKLALGDWASGLAR